MHVSINTRRRQKKKRPRLIALCKSVATLREGRRRRGQGLSHYACQYQHLGKAEEEEANAYRVMHVSINTERRQKKKRPRPIALCMTVTSMREGRGQGLSRYECQYQH
jgi:hypothetical protein